MNTLGESLLQYKVLVWFGDYLFYHLSLNKSNPWLLLEWRKLVCLLSRFSFLLNRTLKASPIKENKKIKIKFNFAEKEKGTSLTWLTLKFKISQKLLAYFFPEDIVMTFVFGGSYSIQACPSISADFLCYYQINISACNAMLYKQDK